MIRYEIYDGNGRHDITYFCRDGRFGDALYMGIYEYLMRRFDVDNETAEAAASWCVDAEPGDEYEAENFSIAIMED